MFRYESWVDARGPPRTWQELTTPLGPKWDCVCAVHTVSLEKYVRICSTAQPYQLRQKSGVCSRCGSQYRLLSTATCLPPDALGTITLSRKQKMNSKALDKVQSSMPFESLHNYMGCLRWMVSDTTQRMLASVLDACALTTGLCAW